MSPRDLDEELVSAFRDETADSLDVMLRLRDGWSELSEVEASTRLLDAFRVFHNLKGAARLVGLEAIEPLAHAAEERMRTFHDANVRVDESEIDLLAHAIRAILGHAEGTVGEAALTSVTAELGRGLEVFGGMARANSSDITGVAESTLVVSLPREKSEIEAEVPERRNLDTVRVGIAHIDRLIGMTGELLTHNAQLGVREARLEAIADSIREALRGVHGESRDAFVTILAEVESLLAGDRTERQRVGLLTGELGDTIRSVRMSRLAGVVPSFRRIAEDAADELGKRIRFDADVGDIALDRRILDGLRDPLMHLVRNAVDHGIEAPLVRVRAGKPESGGVTLSARSLGPNVEISLTDDGRGIDHRAVVARAVAASVIPADRAAGLTEAEARDLIFAPGLSTASEVTHISGRGIGLDVVRTRVTELGGRVEVTSSSRGTTFRLTLPVDVVQTTGLLVRVGDSVLAIPMTHVVRTQRIAASRVQRADGGTIAVEADDEPLRLLWLASLLGLPREPDGPSLMTVVVENGASPVGIVVADVLGEAEFVVRPLPWNLEHVNGIVGAAVLGDGRLAVVLHVASLLQGSSRSVAAEQHGLLASVTRAGRSVLVVDDSVTSRILVRNILDAAGYETLVANDGEEAWEVLQQRSVDLVVTDVQMPRLDGHGLTRRIRKDPRTAEIPVIMVTSLARPEDIALGSEAGADEYIVKGRFDHRTLLEAVGRLT